MDDKEKYIENLINELKCFSSNVNNINIIEKLDFKYTETIYSKNKKNKYKLKYAYGKIDINKVSINTLHEETKKVIVRLDITNKNHTNPDGTQISEPHIHIYQNGSSNYAYPLNSDEFKNLFPDIDDRIELLKSYLKFINVENVPLITQSITF